MLFFKPSYIRRRSKNQEEANKIILSWGHMFLLFSSSSRLNNIYLHFKYNKDNKANQNKQIHTIFTLYNTNTSTQFFYAQRRRRLLCIYTPEENISINQLNNIYLFYFIIPQRC